MRRKNEWIDPAVCYRDQEGIRAGNSEDLFFERKIQESF